MIVEVLRIDQFFVDPVKRGVLILVGEIRRYRNDRYYYYYYQTLFGKSHVLPGDSDDSVCVP